MAMKKICSFLFAALIGFGANAQTFTMCTDASTTSLTGNLEDSGGPGADYQNSENCGFLIDPGCADSITLTFNFFETESGFDFFSVYDGSDNTANQLLNTSGSTLPSPVTATSGTMYIEFDSDGSVTDPGFDVSWTVFVSPQSPVTAGFTPSNSNPAYQEAVTFTDNSTSDPNTWFWDFGDGNTSTMQNPVHSYFTSGAQIVTLIASNCDYSDTTTQIITVQAPPFNTSVDTVKMTVSCDGSIASQNITFNNTDVNPFGYEIASELPLDTVLNRTNRFYTRLTNLVPSLFLFSDGVTGTFISDGGNDMYDTGNILNTDISGINDISYSDNLIVNSTNFGTNGKYFTRKNPGLFMLAADLDNVSEFNITGGTGADGGGSIDGSVLTHNQFGSTYRAFINRTYGTTDPSINRMVIVVDNASASHTFPATTDPENHVISNLNGSKRIYYLLFAGTSGLYIDDIQMQLIFEEFVSWLETIPSYVTISPLTDTISASSSSSVNFSFDPNGINVGTYTNRYTIKNTTSPFATYYLYSEVTVTGNGNLSVSDSCLQFGSILQNDTRLDTLNYSNTGCDSFIINSITTTDGAYTVLSYDTVLLPGESAQIVVDFTPSMLGNINANLVINTNANDTILCLEGEAIVPPVILRAEPNPMLVNLACGDSITENLVIYSDGTNSLDLTSGLIGGDGIYDTSTVQYFITGATTTHNFNLTNLGYDSLFLLVAALGDYDGGLANEFIDDVIIDGISLGQAATQQLPNTEWDTTIFVITGPNLASILSDGIISVDIVNGSGVDAFAADLHHVAIYTTGQKWLNGNIPSTSIASGDSLIVPVNFISEGIKAGTYTSTININSNDPVFPTYSIPVQLTITGVAELVALDSCINFGNILNNSTAFDSVAYENLGCDDLILNSISTTDASYSIIRYDTILAPGQSGNIVVSFNPSTLGANNADLIINTNENDTTLCLTGNSILPPVIIRAEPNPMIVNLACGDSIIQNLTIYSDGSNDLNLTSSFIGSEGIYDTSTIEYFTTGATTTHNFNLTNTGFDTLFLIVAALGDFDGALPDEFITDVVVDGISFGQAAIQQLPNSDWDTTLFTITGSNLTTILADGMISIDVVNGAGVDAFAADLHHVAIYSKAQGWISGTIPATTIASGDSINVPVTFRSEGVRAGVYNSSITIQSNDPVFPTYNVPVQLTITGSADYELSDACIDIGVAAPGNTITNTLFYENTGCDDLMVNSITPSNADFTVITFDNLVAPGGTGSVVISFTPSIVGNVNATLNFMTNVHDSIICITAEGTNITSQFSFGAQDSCTTEIAFTNNTIGQSTSWFWDFGDGSTSTLENPSHLFDSIGTFNVTFVSCNSSGCDTSMQMVTSNLVLDYEIEVIGSLDSLGELEFFVSSTLGNVISATWDFGDGSSFPGLNVLHTYSANGTYLVQADIVTSDPCFITLYDTLQIGPDNIFEFSRNDVTIYPNPSSNGIINIKSPKTDRPVDLEIINSIGKVVRTVNNISSYETLTIEADAGIYLVRLKSEGVPVYEQSIILSK